MNRRIPPGASPTTAPTAVVDARTPVEKLYRLENGENARWIRRANFPAERVQFVQRFTRESVQNIDSVVFFWDASTSRLTFRQNVGYADLRMLLLQAGIRNEELQATSDDLRFFHPDGGDWIFRVDDGDAKGVHPSARLAVIDVINKELNRSIRLRSTQEQKDVIVVQGTLQPLPAENNGALRLAIPGDGPHVSDGGRTRPVTLSALLTRLSGIFRRRFVDQTSSGSEQIELEFFKSFTESDVFRDPARLEVFLAYLAKQTGLKFTHEIQQVTVWELSEATTQPAQ